MDRNNYYHFNSLPLVFVILGKFLGPMNILLILGSATENIVVLWYMYYVGSMVCIGSRVSICIASTTAMEKFRFQL